MAALAKELLFDLAGWTPTIENEHLFFTRCDFISALQTLYDTEQVDTHDIMCLDKFAAGYPIIDIELDFPNARERIIKTLALLEYMSSYTDESFLRHIAVKYPKYSGNSVLYRRKLHEVGRSFDSMEITN